MKDYKVLQIQKSVYADNDKEAAKIREAMKEQGTFLLNVMSSPGSGKTTTLLRTIESLMDEFKIGVIEADLDSDVDAHTIHKTGTDVVQLNTGGMCHIDAGIVQDGLDGLPSNDLDLIIIENIGNLICPAGFDTGASRDIMILSVPEGDDKPLKYPQMFSKVDLLIVNKIDAMDFFNFDLDAVVERVTKLNPDIKIMPISAKTGEGVDLWVDWLRQEILAWKA
ncbi:MAG: hydrogenase nickel incorporation protein HypB [Tissierellia bacterium]|nr:hydrogenase nickel incorporation protein HypB [Tissierellia bacterium]